jgi:Fe-S-cluster containining protein
MQPLQMCDEILTTKEAMPNYRMGAAVLEALRNDDLALLHKYGMRGCYRLNGDICVPITEKLSKFYQDKHDHQKLTMNGALVRIAQIMHKMSPTARLAMARKLVNDYAQAPSKEASCRKGCSYCCQIPVAVSESEARELATLAFPAQRQRLELQASWGELEAKDWCRKPVVERSCVFLVDNECSVYAQRPLRCRTHFSAEDPVKCITGLSDAIDIKMPFAIKAELVTCALRQVEEAWLMPNMVLNAYKSQGAKV